MSRAVMQQALEALEAEVSESWECNSYHPKIQPAITALKQVLAEPEQEPVAWQWLDTANYRKKLPANAIPEHWRPLYTAPTPQAGPKQEPVAYARDKDNPCYMFADPPSQHQPEQEPVARVCYDLPGNIGWNPKLTHLPNEGVYLYTAPTPRRPLTDEEIERIYTEETGSFIDDSPWALADFARAIERAHGIGEQA